MHGAVGFGGLCLVVRHHHDGAAVLFVERVEYRHNFGAHFGVEVAAGFVGKYDLRVSDYGSGYGHALRLSARQLRGEVAHAVRKADAFESFAGKLVLAALEALAV